MLHAGRQQHRKPTAVAGGGGAKYIRSQGIIQIPSRQARAHDYIMAVVFSTECLEERLCLNIGISFYFCVSKNDIFHILASPRNALPVPHHLSIWAAS